MKREQEILFISSSPKSGKGRSLTGDEPGPTAGAWEGKTQASPRRPGAVPSRPEPQSHSGCLSPRPTQILTIAPIIPPPPPPAQAQWEPGPTRAPEAPRLWRSRSRPVAAPRRVGVPLPSPQPPHHRWGPVPTRPTPLLPSSPVLQIHLQDLPVALKEALHIALPGLVAQAADVHPRHPGNSGGGLARPQPPLGGGRRSESAATAAAATGERRDGRSRTPATYASTQHASARLPPSPPSPQAEGNGRERAFASRPAGVGAGLAQGRAGVGRGQVIDRRCLRRGGSLPPPALYVLSRVRYGRACAAFAARWLRSSPRKCLQLSPPSERSCFCPLNREWF